MELIREKGFSIGNADITVCVEHPKLNPHIPLMQKTLSECLGIDLEVKSYVAHVRRSEQGIT